jgi:hypothetical protein
MKIKSRITIWFKTRGVIICCESEILPNVLQWCSFWELILPYHKDHGQWTSVPYDACERGCTCKTLWHPSVFAWSERFVRVWKRCLTLLHKKCIYNPNAERIPSMWGYIWRPRRWWLSKWRLKNHDWQLMSIILMSVITKVETYVTVWPERVALIQPIIGPSAMLNWLRPYLEQKLSSSRSRLSFREYLNKKLFI